MDVRLHRLLPLVFLLSWPFVLLRDNHRSPPPLDAAAGLHPIVLLPGHTCSQLRARLTNEYEPAAAPSCGARKGEGWFRLFENYTALQDPALLPCYAEQLRLVYDPAARDYRNTKGVDVGVVSFGSTRAFGSNNNPVNNGGCMRKFVDVLEGVGYKDGENMFGAPYDFRYAPAPPGQPARQFSRYVSSLRRLIERASERNGDKPVILVSHSHGSLNAIEFLNRNPLPWRRRYVKHFVMASGAGGGVHTLQGLVSTRPPRPGDVLSFGNTSRSFASVFAAVPSPEAFGHAPLVVTRARNYSAYDIPELLAAVGFSDDEVARYRTRALPVSLNLFRAPVVTCINGVGVATVERVVYWDGDLGAEPDEVVYGDGDGAINLASILALDRLIGDNPDQEYYESILLPNTTHGSVLTDDFALERVVKVILEASK